MLLSVVICTWNRAPLLDRTLDQMTRLEVPVGLEWELLVVNNNCSDHTDRVVTSRTGQLPIRLLHESTPGKSFAANSAIDQVRGKYIVWTDDDVLHDAAWLRSYAQAFRDHPHHRFFGGPIELDFEYQPPHWITANLSHVGSAYGLRDLPLDSLEISEDAVPYGANYAICTDTQRQFRFDTRLGDFAGARIGGYETEVMRAMLRTQIRGRWVPQARLKHFVPARALTRDFLRRYFSAQGNGAEVRASLPHRDGKTWMGYPRWMIRKAVQSELRYQIHRAFMPSDTSVPLLTECSLWWGRLKAYRR